MAFDVFKLNVAPDRLFTVPLVIDMAPDPETVTIPALFHTVDIPRYPPLTALVPSVRNEPVPLNVAPPEKLAVPVTVNAPDVFSVPPVRFKLVNVDGAFSVTLPVDTLAVVAAMLPAVIVDV